MKFSSVKLLVLSSHCLLIQLESTFLKFSDGVEMEHWFEKGWLNMEGIIENFRFDRLKNCRYFGKINLQQMRCFARFGIFCKVGTITLPCNFTKINNHQWVFSRFFELCKCYQIVQLITNKQIMSLITVPDGIYLLKVNNRNTRTKVWNMFKVNNKATKTTPMASFWWLYC